MNAILKYMLRNMLERKLRTFLVIFAIAISSGMFLASITISESLVRIQFDKWRQSFGYTDIVIQSRQDSPSKYLYMNRALDYIKDMEYVIGDISGYGTYITLEGEKKGVTFKGIDLADLQKLTPLNLYAQKGINTFSGMKVVISIKTAEKYSLKVGDSILFDMNGTIHRFRICGIAQTAGPFIDEGRSFCAVIPVKTLSSLMNIRGKVGTIYLKLKNPMKKSRYIYLLSKDYGRYSVKEAFNEWQVKRETDRIATPIMLVTVILSFMCIYIIFTTFTIIILERLPVIGTFRSIGASVYTANATLLFESIMYGVSGGLTGCCMGIGLLNAMTIMFSNMGIGSMKFNVNINPGQLLLTMVLGLVLSILGSFIPIYQAASMPIKNVILGMTNEKKPQNRMRFAFGFLIFCCSLAIPFILRPKSALIIDTLCVIGLMLSFNLVTPDILLHLYGWMGEISNKIGFHMTFLAIKNIKGNRSSQSIISLLLIGISSLYMISTLNYSQIREITERFDRNLYDMTMEMDYVYKGTLGLIAGIDGVKDVCASFYSYRIEVEGHEDPIWRFLGIDKEKFLSFYSIKTGGDAGTLIKKLDEGRYMLLSNALKERYGVIAGDTIILKLSGSDGRIVKQPYKVLGFFDSINQGQWSSALISAKYFKLDVRNRFYGPVYIKAIDNAVYTAERLKAAFARRQPVIELKEDMEQEMLESNRQVFSILQGFSVLTLVIGTLGILNNFIIGFMQRRRQLAMFRASGMSRRQMSEMLLIEALAQGFGGCVIGIFAGALATWVIIPRIIKALATESNVFFSWYILVSCLAAGVFTGVIASVVPLVKALRLELIPAIKYE